MFRRLLPACSICLILSLQSFTLAEDAPFKGVFKGEGKEAKLTSLTLKKGKDDRKDRLILTFSEKKQTDKDSDFAAMFGDLGSALVITLKEDGTITGCLVAHSAHDKGGFNDIGNIELKDMKKADGTLSGRLTSNGELKAFGKTWEVDLTFKVKMP